MTTFDVIISGGAVLDGTVAPSRRADVGVAGAASASEVIEAIGRCGRILRHNAGRFMRLTIWTHIVIDR